MRIPIILLALASLSCEPPPLPRACHLQEVSVRYLPAHPCTKLKSTDDGLIAYEGFCPEQCEATTTCTLWCDQLDAGKTEGHIPHTTVTMNLGSNSIRCNDQGQLQQ